MRSKENVSVQVSVRRDFQRAHFGQWLGLMLECDSSPLEVVGYNIRLQILGHAGVII